jgi:hypothetical protein
MDPALVIALVFGALLTMTGIVRFIRNRTGGHNSITVHGMECQLAGSSLVTVLRAAVLTPRRHSHSEWDLAGGADCR